MDGILQMTNDKSTQNADELMTHLSPVYFTLSVYALTSRGDDYVSEQSYRIYSIISEKNYSYFIYID